jgi:CRP/FNR family transcriptional regulator, cyclic AMP receptor protein
VCKFIGVMEAPVAKLANDAFDPKAFLAKVGSGKTILKFEKNQHVFEQGDVAGAVFYIQKGSSLSYPSMARKR